MTAFGPGLPLRADRSVDELLERSAEKLAAESSLTPAEASHLVTSAWRRAGYRTGDADRHKRAAFHAERERLHRMVVAEQETSGGSYADALHRVTEDGRR